MTGFDVRCRVGEPLQVTVHEIVVSSRAIEAMAPQQFELRALPFDLDRMCADAMRRVESFIDRRAAELRRQVRVH